MMVTFFAGLASTHAQGTVVPRFGIFEGALTQASTCGNPYTDVTATAQLIRPEGQAKLSIPLFWDGGKTWRFRFSPEEVGTWQWAVESDDPGLGGQSGSFRVIDSQNAGGIRPMERHPYHFQRQNGEPFWFMGDTAWALYTDSEREKHDRASAGAYVDARARQGFNVIHSMLLSEAGWGNAGGPPFENISEERINPAYWREVDERLAYLNGRGITGGLALAWGCKRGKERFPWGAFPSLEARERYARYIAARYSAFDVYFIVSGEWHGEVKTRPGATEEQIRGEFTRLGDVVRGSDPHGRMIVIHPMTRDGSVREFVGTEWMSFGDYQQNYRDLHGRMLMSRRFDRPVVNSEYAYYLRDQNGDGKCDKPNSATLDAIRHATWDIAMTGGYFVTGFGSTYFGGNRHPGPFDVEDPRNDDWEEQVGHVRKLFTELEWWTLAPHDEVVKADVPRSADGKALGVMAPPAVTYWALAELGRRYVAYVRGLKKPVTLSLGSGAEGEYRVRQFDPRTGDFTDLGVCEESSFRYSPPDAHDWVVVLEK